MFFRKMALADDRIQNSLSSVVNFHEMVTNHKNSELSINKLLFLQDIRFDTEVPEIKTAVDEIIKHKNEH